VKAVVLYESADNLAAKAPLYIEAHRARWAEFRRRGKLLMIGPFANAQDDGTMAIFTTRQAAEEFVRGDPFVLNGVVRKWIIRDWIEAIVPEVPAELPLIGACQVGPLIQGVRHVPEQALEP
jgi:uncharacterized protein